MHAHLYGLNQAGRSSLFNLYTQMMCEALGSNRKEWHTIAHKNVNMLRGAAADVHVRTTGRCASIISLFAEPINF